MTVLHCSPSTARGEETNLEQIRSTGHIQKDNWRTNKRNAARVVCGRAVYEHVDGMHERARLAYTDSFLQAGAQ
jgi:hypothetical protein